MSAWSDRERNTHTRDQARSLAASRPSGDGGGQFPAAPRPGGDASGRTTPIRCLLDLDPDLADELDRAVRPAARAAAVAPTAGVDPGRLPLAEWLAFTEGGPGVLVLDGLVAVHIRVTERVVAELVGSGDLIQPASRGYEEFLACEVTWSALVPSRFALLDRDFSKRVRFWPQIANALLQRPARRTTSLNVQRAIAAQPRLEVRLALMLWHLGARWGKVEPGGIRVPVPLTHQLLGQLVAAERPSVSHALARLSQAGLVTGQGDEWHLHGSLDDHLATMAEPVCARADRVVTGLGGLHRATG